METGDKDQRGLEEKVRQWLEVSGKKSELQAKLRAELYSAIQTEIAFRGDIHIAESCEKRSLSSREKIINWLVSQHLTTNRHWLSNSVFVTEGEMLPNPRGNTSLNQYETEVATPELVETLLADLKLSPEVSREIIQRYSGGKESIISIALSILANQFRGRVQDSQGGQDQTRLSVPESLRAIDKKYELILEDFHQRRREPPTRDTPHQDCGKCQDLQMKEKKSFDSDSSSNYIEKKAKGSNLSNKKRDQSLSSPEGSQHEHFDLLHKKMDELLCSKEKDLSVIEDLKRKLAGSEEKILNLKDEMVEKEQRLRDQRYEEKIENLQKIIENQNENMKGQSHELLKLRSQISLKELAAKTNLSTRSSPGKDNESPTVDFLASIKNKLGNIEREERSIEEDFDDLCSGISSHEILNTED